MKLVALTIVFASLALSADGPPKPLSAEDKEEISRATIRTLNARVVMLEAMIAGQMGVQHQKDYDSARAALLNVIASEKEKYKTNCEPDLLLKVWNCPAPTLEPEKK